jgi:hypothetical protein
MKNTNLSDVNMGEPVSIENLTVHVMALGDHYDLKNKNYEFQAQVFHVKGENFINKMNADISGNMTSSIIDSMKIMTNSV